MSDKQYINGNCKTDIKTKNVDLFLILFYYLIVDFTHYTGWFFRMNLESNEKYRWIGHCVLKETLECPSALLQM